MASSARHHFIPQHYLRNFADSNEGLYQIEKRHDPKPIGTRVKKAGFQHNFHTIDHENKEPDRKSVEHELPQLEGLHAQMLKALLEKRKGVSDERLSLNDFVALTYYRTPFQKTQIEDLLRANVEVLFRKLEEEGKFPPVPESLMPHMTDGRIPLPRVDIKNWKLLEMMLQAYSEGPIQEILSRMNSIVLFVSDSSSAQLITSDNPVVIYDRDYDLESPYGSGFATPSVEIAIPLSKRCLAVFRHDHNFPGELDDQTVTEYNRRMIVASDRFLYLGQPTERILSDVHSLHSKHLFSSASKIKTAQERAIITKQIPVCLSHFK